MHVILGLTLGASPQQNSRYSATTVLYSIRVWYTVMVISQSSTGDDDASVPVQYWCMTLTIAAGTITAGC